MANPWPGSVTAASPSASTSSALNARDLTLDYGPVRALDRVSFDVPPGRIGLVGANGAGKSTLIKLSLGLLSPTAGEVTVHGRPPEARHRVGYMPETSALPLDVRAADFVMYAAQLAGLPARDARRRASETLYLVGLDEERFRFIGEFSTGMRQRVQLAQAVVHDPEIVFLDEPTAGLDPDGREEMLDLIIRLGEFGASVVFSTHIISDIERTCQWAILLDAGRLLRSGPIGELASSGMLRVELVDRVSETVAAMRRRGLEPLVEGSAIRVPIEADTHRLVQAAVAESGAGLHTLEEASISLEAAFFESPPPPLPEPV